MEETPKEGNRDRRLGTLSEEGRAAWDVMPDPRGFTGGAAPGMQSGTYGVTDEAFRFITRKVEVSRVRLHAK